MASTSTSTFDRIGRPLAQSLNMPSTHSRGRLLVTNLGSNTERSSQRATLDVNLYVNLLVTGLGSNAACGSRRAAPPSPRPTAG
jgi:hypothetical protein